MRITIVGTGYVGLVTGACLAELGHQVTCVDLIKERVEQINRGEAPFYEPELPRLLNTVTRQGTLQASTSLPEAMRECELSMITVGTPANADGIDLTAVADAAGQIGTWLHLAAPYHVVTVKSTVTPGTTATLVRSRVEAASRQSLGKFGLCMNPEFLREGAAVTDFRNPDRIVIGQSDQRAGNLAAEMYRGFTCPVIMTTLENAEMIKYTSNTLLATLISFSNEIASLCEAIPGCDVDAVMDAIHLDKRLSPIVNGERIKPDILSYLRTSSGYGGSCLPKDVLALRMFAKHISVSTPLLDAVTEVNTNRPRVVVERIIRTLGSLRNRKIAMLGLAFKPGTDDLRFSPAIEIINHLRQHGAIIHAYDPVALPAAAGIQNEQVILSDSPESAVTDADAAVIGTAWPEFAELDWHTFSNLMKTPYLFDARNAFRDKNWPASLRYIPIGVCIEE